MGIDLKYGAVTTERGKIMETEPVFVFRSHDVLAPLALTRYRDVCRDAGCSSEFIQDIERAIRAFTDWNGFRKLPD